MPKTTLTPAEQAAFAGTREELEPLRWQQPTIAVASLGIMLVSKRGFLKPAHVRVAVAGSAGSTVLVIRKNGVDIGTLTVDNAVADPYVAPRVAYTDEAAATTVPGDVIEVAVTTAPTGGTGLSVLINHATRYD